MAMALERFDPTQGSYDFDWQALGLSGVQGVDWPVVVMALLRQYGGAVTVPIATIQSTLRMAIADGLRPVMERQAGADSVVVRIAYGPKALEGAGGEVVEGQALERGAEALQGPPKRLSGG